jgi:hypothetical protein
MGSGRITVDMDAHPSGIQPETARTIRGIVRSPKSSWVGTSVVSVGTNAPAYPTSATRGISTQRRRARQLIA